MQRHNDNADDLAVLQQGRPYIRSITAFLIWLRLVNSEGVGGKTDDLQVQGAYFLADKFLNQLEKDVSGNTGGAK